MPTPPMLLAAPHQSTTFAPHSVPPRRATRRRKAGGSWRVAPGVTGHWHGHGAAWRGHGADMARVWHVIPAVTPSEGSCRGTSARRRRRWAFEVCGRRRRGPLRADFRDRSPGFAGIGHPVYGGLGAVQQHFGEIGIRTSQRATCAGPRARCDRRRYCLGIEWLRRPRPGLGAPGENESGRGSGADRAVESRETDADQARAQPFLPPRPGPSEPDGAAVAARPPPAPPLFFFLEQGGGCLPQGPSDGCRRAAVQNQTECAKGWFQSDPAAQPPTGALAVQLRRRRTPRGSRNPRDRG
eukprot:gene8257-biopygen18111